MEDKEKYKNFKDMFRATKNVMAVLIWLLTAGLPFLLKQLYDLFISENQSQFGLFGVFGIFVMATVVVFSCFCVIHYFYNKRSVEIQELRYEIASIKSTDNKSFHNCSEIQLNCCLQHCKELLVANNDLLTAMGIVDLYGLSKIESTLPVKDVWILSADLLNELNDEFIRNIVKENMNKGIRYTYFHSNRDGERSKAMKLEYMLNVPNNPITCISIDNNKYKLLFSFADVVIYDPLSEKTTIFVGMGTNKLMENALYIKLDDDTASIVLETLNEEYQKQKF